MASPMRSISEFPAFLTVFRTGVDEVPIYKGFFELGFRNHVPSLIAKVSEMLDISLGQRNPPAWRTLIAIQNLGELENFTLGVEEICFRTSFPLCPAEKAYIIFILVTKTLMFKRFQRMIGSVFQFLIVVGLRSSPS